LRFRGQIAIASGEGSAESATSWLTRAIDVAREQNARLEELRAATNLARLWAEQGRRDEARDLLAPIHGWFSEGFGMRDLQDARALLDELR
jgi:predicted ATPase